MKIKRVLSVLLVVLAICCLFVSCNPELEEKPQPQNNSTQFTTDVNGGVYSFGAIIPSEVSNITVKNATILGDLVIRSSGKITLDNCDISGKIILEKEASRALADAPTLKVTNAKKEVSIEIKREASIEADGNTTIAEVKVEAKVEIKGESTKIENIIVPCTVENAKIAVIDGASVKKIEVNAPVAIFGDGKVEDVVIPTTANDNIEVKVEIPVEKIEVNKTVTIVGVEEDKITTGAEASDIEVKVKETITSEEKTFKPCNEHEWDRGTVETEATCTEKGLKVYHCTNADCTAAKNEEIKALEHNFDTEYTSDGTSHWHKCLNEGCTAKSGEESHTEEIIPGKASTCTETGLSYGKKCSVCGEVIKAQTTVALKEHFVIIDYEVKATCTTEGKTQGKHCYYCKEVFEAQHATPATGHDFENGIVTKAATCIATGIKKCKNCDETETIPIIAHNFDTKYTSDGTSHWHACLTKGCTAKSDEESHELGTCSVCGYITLDAMIDLSSVIGAPSIKVSNTEVTYKKWYEVRVWAENNGYTFANIGTEGTSTNNTTPSDTKNYPVGSVNWRDAIVWCNAYSEMMGLTPVYYADADYTTPLRVSTNSNTVTRTEAGTQDFPYIYSSTSGNTDMDNCTSTGFRLPTVYEFKLVQAAGESYKYAGSNNVDEVCWYYMNTAATTRNVASLKANAWGLYDCCGNVEEWCFDWRPASDLRTSGGGSVMYSKDICESGHISARDPYANRESTKRYFSGYGLRVYQSVLPTTN